MSEVEYLTIRGLSRGLCNLARRLQGLADGYALQSAAKAAAYVTA